MTPSLPEPARARIAAIAATAETWRDPEEPARAAAVEQALSEAEVFTPEAVAYAINHAMHTLHAEAMERWLAGRYDAGGCVLVDSAEQAPTAGLADMIGIVISGRGFRGVARPGSGPILQAFLEAVRERLPTLDARFGDAEALAKDATHLVATGGEATDATLAAVQEAGVGPARVLRRPLVYGVAVLDGQEGPLEREGLAEDALLHEGLATTSTALVWAPRGLDPDPYFDAFAEARSVYPPAPPTPRGLKMQQAFLEATGQSHASADDLSFLVSRGGPERQPPGHIRWVEYDSAGEALAWITDHLEEVGHVTLRPDGLRLLEDVDTRVRALGDAHRPTLEAMSPAPDVIAWLSDHP